MNRSALATLIVVILVAGVFGFNALFTVHQTQQALVLQFGEPRDVIIEPGLHIKIPLIQNVVYLDKRLLHLDSPSFEAIASDQKRLVVDAYLRYRIVDPLLFYQSVRTHAGADARLQNVLESSLREAMGTAPLIDIVSSQRESLMARAAEATANQAANFGIEIVDVRIKRTDLPEENSQAIYAEMRAEREQEAREFRAQGAEEALITRSRADRNRTVILANARRESEILRGEGDALAVKIFADAFGTDVEFFQFYRTMQAYREALQADDTTMVLTPDSEFFKFFRGVLGADLPGLAPLAP